MSLNLLSSLLGDLTRRTEVVEANSADVNDLRTRFSKVSTSISPTFTSGSSLKAAKVDINSLACQLKPRMFRMNNVVFYNVPEAHASNIPNTIQVRDLLSIVPSCS